jgi:hypothetical protein
VLSPANKAMGVSSDLCQGLSRTQNFLDNRREIPILGGADIRGILYHT